MFIIKQGYEAAGNKNTRFVVACEWVVKLFQRHQLMMPVILIGLSASYVNADTQLSSAGFSANVSSVNSGKCMDVASASKAIGANIIQNTCNTGLSQKVVFTPVAGKTNVYSLSFANSGLCMGVYIGRRQDGAFIVQEVCNGNLNQQYLLQSAGNNQYQLVVQHTRKLIDVQLSSTSDGAALIQNQLLNINSQKWLLNSISSAMNPVQMENALATPSFQMFPIANNNEIEGYASQVSVDSGQSINFFVNAKIDTSYTLTLYRLGWYNGVGVRQVAAPVSLPGIKQVMPVADSSTGLMEANWINPYTITVPIDWVSGYYVAAVVGNQSGLGRVIPFTVTNNGRYSKYILQSPVSTWQAYNNWGGRSMFTYNSANAVTATQVSFNRPYGEGFGLAIFMQWEINMLRFLEREGYDVAYQTDVDTHLNGASLWTHQALISVGQSEFWTANIRNNIEFALSHGQSIGSFGANAGYWQSRLNPSSTGQAARTLVCYKQAALAQDPFALDADPTNDIYITTLWRASPVSRPENALLGIMYSYETVHSDVVISDAAHWVFAGTNLHNGDKLPGLLGGLIDSYFDNGLAPANTQILAHSPATATIFGDMSIYTKTCLAAPCVNNAATVFSVGTLNWTWGLDGFNNNQNLVSPAAQQITRNVLNAMVQ